MSPLVYIIAGIAFLATLGGVYYKVHHDGYEEGVQEITAKWRAANAAAETQARAKETADKKAKEKADAEHQAAVASLNASIAKLRADADRRRAYFLPPAAPSACGTDIAAFDRTEYLRAYGNLVEGLRGLANEGTQAVVDLDNAKAWAQNH